MPAFNLGRHEPDKLRPLSLLNMSAEYVGACLCGRLSCCRFYKTPSYLVMPSCRLFSAWRRSICSVQLAGLLPTYLADAARRPAIPDTRFRCALTTLMFCVTALRSGTAVQARPRCAARFHVLAFCPPLQSLTCELTAHRVPARQGARVSQYHSQVPTEL